MLFYEPSASRCAQLQICYTSTFPTVPVAILNLARAAKVSFVRVLANVFPEFPAFVKQVEMWGICSFTQLVSFCCTAVCTNKSKTATVHQSQEYLGSSGYSCCFSITVLKSFKPFMQNHHFTIFTSQGKLASL